MGSPWQGAGGYHGFDGDNKASLMTSNLLGSVDDSENLLLLIGTRLVIPAARSYRISGMIQAFILG